MKILHFKEYLQMIGKKNESFDRTIKKAEDLGDVISDYDTWYEEQEQQDQD